MKTSQIILRFGAFWLVIGLLIKVLTGQWNVSFIMSAFISSVITYWFINRKNKQSL